MSQMIDERVVEMRFDNKQFESGVKESLNTLDKLKAALNLEGSAKSFEKLDKAANSVSLEGISAGIEALQKRFSTLGIVGMRTIENITDSLMRMTSSAVSYASDAIISGGLKRAQNIENAHFQLQALLKDEIAVQAVMDNAMASVDGTAYAYDEAAKAASQFAASGMRAGEEMKSALRAITGVAAMTNSEYEGISRIFTTVAGNGRLMGDQLLQLSSRGLNAAATIADYFREVQGQAGMTESKIREMVSNGEISFQTFAAAMDWAFGESAFRANETFTGALSNMRSALARIGAEFFSPLIEQNSDLILLINTLRERINDVKKALTFDEQRSAISGLTKVTGLQIETLEEMFSTIDENGAVTNKNLQDLSKNGVNAAKDLTDFINGVTNGTVRTTYSTKIALDELTGGLEVNEAQVRKFVEDGQIDLKTFTSAMEKAYGDQTALSKQFTDGVLNAAKSVSEFLSNLDLSKPMAVVYYGVETVKNVFKGLYSVLKPIGQAFADVFLSFSMDDVITLADQIERLTSKMKISEKGSKDLHDAFQGVFSVAKLLIDAIAGLFGVVVPVNKPIRSLTDLVLSLAGAMGRGLISFTEWINKSPLLGRAYDKIASGVQKAMSAVADFIANLDEFADYIYNLPVTQKIINGVIKAFNKLYVKCGKYLTVLIQKMKDFGDYMAELIPDKAQDFFDAFIKKVKEVGENLDDLDLSKVTELFHKLTEKLKELLDVFKGNEGIDTFIQNMKLYFKELTDAFSFDTLFNNIEKFKDLVGGFVEWFRKTIGPAFEDFSFGGAVASAGGLGIIYAVIKAIKVFDKIGKVTSSIPETLNALKGTLVAYQKDLKADAMLKIAKAIAVLSVALTVLSFADTERVYKAAIALGLIGAALVAAVGHLTKGIGGIKSVSNSINSVAKTLAKSLNNLAKAVKWKAIGSTIKDMTIAIAVIIGSIVVLALAYSKDSENMNKAVTLIAKISAVMFGLIAVMTLLGNKANKGVNNFAKMGVGIVAMAASVAIVISAIQILFKMEIPDDWAKKLGILARVFVGVGVLAIVFGAASKLAGGNKTITSGPLLGAAASIYLVVLALNKLFNMELPADYGTKLRILTGIFVGIGLLILAVGAASKLARGKTKATGTLLAMAVDIAVIVGALAVLSLFPAQKLIVGAVSLGIVLITLGVSMALSAKVVGKETWKSVLAMAINVGVITAALGILSLVPWAKLLKATLALGAVLLSMAGALYAASKITDKLSFISILAMAANVGVIAVALYTLSSQPWESLLAAGVSLSAVLLSVAASFKIIDSVHPDATSITSFLLGTVGVIMVGVAIGMIASQPWEGLLSAGAALSAVLLSLASSFKIISSANINIVTFASFVAGVIGVVVIGIILEKLASQPWENLLAAAASIAIVLTAMVVAMAVCALIGSAAPAALAGILILDVFIADLALVMYALGLLSDQTKEIITGGGNVLIQLGDFLGQFIGNIIAGIGTGVGSALANIGTGLSDFVNNASDFFDVMSNLDPSVLAGVKNLAAAVMILTAAEFINGITSFIPFFDSGGFSDFGNQLNDLGAIVKQFADQVSGIDANSVEAASYCAKVLAELYANMPKEDGWMQKITGQQKTLAEFAEELIPFGKALVEYSNTVKGQIDQAAVEASIKAAEVLAAFADTLPNMGGLAGLIFGEQKTLAEFAEELILFGYALVEYSDTVKGAIDQEAVEASIKAAEVLLAFNDNLPDMGGLFGLIFGNQKTLAEFAEEIIPFGEAMVKYSSIVAGSIDQSAVTASANAASALVALQNGLGKSGGLLSLFSGDNDLEDFGKQLKKFGEGLASYSNSVSDINLEQLDGVIREVKELIEIANGVKTLDTSSMTGFADALKKMGNNGIDGFIQTFNDSTSKVNTAVQGLITTTNNVVTNSSSNLNQTAQTTGKNIPDGLATGIENNVDSINTAAVSLATIITSIMQINLTSNTFSALGQNVVTYLINGINTKKPLALTTVKNLCTAIISQFKTFLPNITFSSIGERIVQALANGISSKKGTAEQASKDVSNAVISAFKNTMSISIFNEIGANAGQGLADGITSKTSAIKDAAVKAAEEVAKAAKQTLDEHSPSKVLLKIGEFASLGLAKGILAKIFAIGNASEEAAEVSVDVMNGMVQAIADVLEDNPDFQPTIRPVLDLSGVRDGFNQITQMFNERFKLATYERAMAASESFGGRTNVLDQTRRAEDGTPKSNTYQFIQNNYSPKPLSRVEIYRQSKNLFSTWKGAVERV